MRKPYGPIENTLDCIVQGHASLDCAIHDISQKIVELGTFVDQVTLKEFGIPGYGQISQNMPKLWLLQGPSDLKHLGHHNINQNFHLGHLQCIICKS